MDGQLVLLEPAINFAKYLRRLCQPYDGSNSTAINFNHPRRNGYSIENQISGKTISLEHCLSATINRGSRAPDSLISLATDRSERRPINA